MIEFYILFYWCCIGGKGPARESNYWYRAGNEKTMFFGWLLGGLSEGFRKAFGGLSEGFRKVKSNVAIFLTTSAFYRLRTLHCRMLVYVIYTWREGCLSGLNISTAPQRERSDAHKVTRRLRKRFENLHRATTRAIWHAQSDERVSRAHARFSQNLRKGFLRIPLQLKGTRLP